MYRMLVLVVLSLLTVSCSVISKEVRKEALKDVTFTDLAESPSHYVGKTVILGGYILAARRGEGGVLIDVAQAPLSAWEIPGDRNQSEGLFVVIDKHSEDPAQFRKGLAITVAGRVLGMMTTGKGDCPGPCLEIESRELHLRWEPGDPVASRGRGFLDLGNVYSSPWSFEAAPQYPR